MLNAATLRAFDAEAERLTGRLDPAAMRGASVLVTGASGMIGAWLTMTFLTLDRIHGLGMKIHGMSRNMEKAAQFYNGFPLTAISRNVTDAVADLPRMDYVVHAASPAGPALFAARPFDVAAANLQGTANLLRKAVTDGTRRFIFISTHETYGQGKAIWREEDCGALDFLAPRSCYPESKRAAENACACCHNQYGLSTGIARLARAYGPGMNLDSGLFISDFLRDACGGRAITIKGDGGLIRPLGYISDMVDGILTVFSKGGAGEAYNVSPMEAHTIREIADELAAIAGTTVNAAPEGPGGGPVLDTSRLRSLGWTERVGLRDGLKHTLASLTCEA